MVVTFIRPIKFMTEPNNVYRC